MINNRENYTVDSAFTDFIWTGFFGVYNMLII